MFIIVYRLLLLCNKIVDTIYEIIITLKSRFSKSTLKWAIYLYLTNADRHKADEILENQAWEVFKSKDTGIKEKAAS
ncbi:Uncharacterized protein FWK35_00022232 [Aphis craccivora]|uniref:Uncharacterized protein n=1 Tax=Aphis craccivora TaxID=307492 RepID=A0A6G0Y4B6_APHCR|nr:Uncharacterized protein FWK35_00022232 [Aphis craccivora]